MAEQDTEGQEVEKLPEGDVPAPIPGGGDSRTGDYDVTVTPGPQTSEEPDGA